MDDLLPLDNAEGEAGDAGGLALRFYILVDPLPEGR